MVGAALAGGLVALVGAANALLVDAASFALAGAVLALGDARHAPAPPAAGAPEVGRGRLDVRSGSCATAGTSCARDPVLMGIGVMVAITNLLDQAWSSVLVPVWARDSGYGVGAVGLLAATFGAAAVLGSVAGRGAWASGCRASGPTWSAFFIAGVPRFVMLALGAPLWVGPRGAAVGGGCVAASSTRSSVRCSSSASPRP